MSFDEEVPAQWFKWFTEEVINDRKFFQTADNKSRYSDRTATKHIDAKVREFAKQRSLKCKISPPFDFSLWREENEHIQLIAAIEHENKTKWLEIEADFKKLLWSKSMIRIGIFYAHETYKDTVEKLVKEHLNKMRSMIINTCPKMPDEKWLIIFGVHYNKPVETIYYKGSILEGNEFKDISIKSL